MADGWQTDLGVIGAIVSMISTIGGYFYLHGRQSKSSEEISNKAIEAHRKAEAVGTDLATYKLEAVEKFVPRIHLHEMETRIIARMDKQDERVENNFQKLWERIDRAFFHGEKKSDEL